jgi:hypothetical protein
MAKREWKKKHMKMREERKGRDGKDRNVREFRRKMWNNKDKSKAGLSDSMLESYMAQRDIIWALKSEVVFFKIIITKQSLSHLTPWLVVRKRTIPTERPPLVSEISANFCG